MSKPRVVKNYNKVPVHIIRQIKLANPYGFEKKLITYKNAKGKFVSALPYEAEDFYYLIKMTRAEAQQIILNDKDYNEKGNLKDEAILELNENAKGRKAKNKKVKAAV